MTPNEFRRHYDLFPEAMLLVSPEGLLLAGNAAAGALLRRRPGELSGASLAGLVEDPPDKVARFLRLCGSSSHFVPGALAFRDGTTGGMRCRIEGALLVPREDAPLLLLRLQAQDVALGRFRALNERIAMLDREVLERRLAEREVHAGRELLRTMLTSIGDAVIATGPEGAITFMNTVAESLTGWTEPEARGQPLENVFAIINENTRCVVESPVSKVRRCGTIVGLANHTVLVARDGTERPIADSGAPIRDPGGQLLGVVLVFRDVTEIRKQENALQETNAWLQKSNENLRQFAYAAAHDLREPLRMVSLYSQLLASTYRGKLGEEADKFLEHAIGGAARMTELLDGLFAFVTAGDATELRPEPVNCNELVATAVLNLETLIEEAAAEVTWDPLPVLMGHAAPLTTLFQNLIGNAVKYRREGSDAVRVHISATRRHREWLIGVQDNGIGIEPQYHQRIFGVFKRLHPAKYTGTGIGLALCARVVESYGGTIWVESEEGLGARFLFTIPDRRWD